MYNLYYNMLHIQYVITADGFPPGGGGPYTCIQKAKDSNTRKEKQCRSQNTKNRKQNT